MSSRLVTRAGFLELVEEAVEGPDGEAFTRYTVKHPGAVAVVPVDEEGNVVLVRQYRTAARASLLEIPAGKREQGEAPEVTAARELAEEVGLRAGELVKLGEFFNSPGFTDEQMHVFLGERLADAPGPQFEAKAEERHMEILRIPLADAYARVRAGEIADAKTIIGLAWAREYREGT